MTALQPNSHSLKRRLWRGFVASMAVVCGLALMPFILVVVLYLILLGKVEKTGRRVRAWYQRNLWKYWLGKRVLTPQNKAFVQAILSGNAHNAGIFLDRGADPNLRLRYRIPVTSIAADRGYTEIVRLLIDAGGEFNY